MPAIVDADDEPARDWRERLDALGYATERVEITDQQISGVTGQELRPSGWTKHLGAPAGADAAAAAELSDADPGGQRARADQGHRGARD